MLTGVIINVVSFGYVMGWSGIKCGNEYNGVYRENPNGVIEIYVCDIGDGNIETTKRHEYAHYIWFKLLQEEDREKYRKLYESHLKIKSRAFPNSYSLVNVDESFANDYALKSSKNFFERKRLKLVQELTKLYPYD